MIIVALGANLRGGFESPRAALVAALAALDKKGIIVKASSRLWLTAPVPVSDQPMYHNAVVSVATTLSPYQLLEMLHAIEHDLGRVRTERNAPRIIDLDLIAYDDVVIDKPELIVPHPRMHSRAFVLMPMAEVTPLSWRHPALGKTLAELLADLPPQDAKPDEAPFP